MEPEPEHVASSISLTSYTRLLRDNRNFRRLWLAQIVSEIGDWFYTLSIYTLLLQLTGHAGSVALALVLQVLPQTFVGPTAGVVNDRLKRKHVMIAADIIRFVVVLAMLLVRSRSMVWLVYPLLLAETTMTAFFEPARSSVVPNIAAEGEVLVANTLIVGDLVGEPADWSFGRRSGGRILRARRSVHPQCAFVSYLGVSDQRDAVSPSHMLNPQRRCARGISSTSLRCWRGFATSAVIRLCCPQFLPRPENLWSDQAG